MKRLGSWGRTQEVIAKRLLLPGYRAQRWVIPSRRPQLQSFRRALRFREGAVRWSPQQREEWVLKQLRKTVRYAGQTTPYYRDLFRAEGFDPSAEFCFQDFARLPVLERESVRKAGEGMISEAVPREHLREDATGGSTGVPTRLWVGPEERGWREGGSEHFRRRVGVPPGSRQALLWGHHLDPVASDKVTDRLRDFAEHQRWFDCFRLSPAVLERYHRELQHYRPRVIVAYASALGLLADRVRELGEQPVYPACCMITGAEKLLPHHREAAQEVFSRPVHEQYGGRDVGLLGFQLDAPESLDFTIDWCNVLVEPETVDERSSILVTKLHADGMPMIRYRVGDVGHFPDGSRPGHPAFHLHEVIGRDLDGIWLPDGRWVHGIEIPHLLKDYPVREFQLVQGAGYDISLDLVPAAGFTSDHTREIEDVLAANFDGIAVTAKVVERIGRTRANKWRPVITLVDRRRATTDE